MSEALSTPWEPTEDDLHWTLEELDAIAIDGVWQTGEMQYVRTGEKELTLLSRTERSAEAHLRVLIVLAAIEWTCKDDEANVVPDDPLAQLQQAQEQARGWECPVDDCDTNLVDCDLTDVLWVIHGMQPAMDAEGNETQAERWLVHLTCTGCASETPMNPLDYALLAGDDLFYTYRTRDAEYTSLSREATIELVDAGDAGVPLGSFDLQGNTLPPHMQGTYCMVRSLHSEEE